MARKIRIEYAGAAYHVGRTEFKERMLAMVEQPLRQGRSGSYSGAAKRAHGEAEAERLLARGLAALELAEGQLAETRKGAPGRRRYWRGGCASIPRCVGAG